MISENKLKKIFNILLGDKYKIVPIDDPEKTESKAEGVVVDDKELENIQAVLGLGNDIGEKEETGEAELGNESDNALEDDPLKMEFDDDFSDEAKKLFERDKDKSDYFRNKNTERSSESEETIGSTEIIEEAQIVYDRITKDLTKRIEELESSRKTARSQYIDILRNNDKDDPFRVQLAERYNPESIQEEIDYLRRIKNDPFYGKFKIVSEEGKIVDFYIGRIAFENDGILIVSPWSEMGKAFRQNRSEIIVKGIRYSVLNKYTFIMDGHRITGVNDESPR